MRINTPWKLVAVAFLQLCIYFWYFAPSQTLPRCSLCFPSPTRNGTSEYTLKINKTHISCFMYVTQSPKKAPLFLTLLCTDWLTDARIETFLVVQSVHCIFEFVDYISCYPQLSSVIFGTRSVVFRIFRHSGTLGRKSSAFGSKLKLAGTHCLAIEGPE